jgi:hypothetical protein
MVKALKDFRTYVLHSKIISYVPTNAIKDILVQLDSDGRRGRWLAKIQYFDIEVKPTKLVKGQGLARMLVESNFRALGINNLGSHDSLLDIKEIDDQEPMIQIEDKFSSSTWYHDIVTYLLTLQCPNNMTPPKARTLKLHAIKYCIIDGKLYWKYPLGFLLCFLTEDETGGVIDEFHEGVCRGNHARRETNYKILRARYYWQKLFTDVNARIRACNSCQLFASK